MKENNASRWDHFFRTREGEWPLDTQLLDHYEASQIAFHPDSAPDVAFRAFEKIYDELKGSNRQVFRSCHAGATRWPARQVFETIGNEFAEFSWAGPVNLLNFVESGTGPRLQACLDKDAGNKAEGRISAYGRIEVPALLQPRVVPDL